LNFITRHRDVDHQTISFCRLLEFIHAPETKEIPMSESSIPQNGNHILASLPPMLIASSTVEPFVID